MATAEHPVSTQSTKSPASSRRPQPRHPAGDPESPTSEQFDRMRQGHGFVAALDQSGGRTPRMLAAYGIEASAYSNDVEMFDLVDGMRARIICSPRFDAAGVLATILFQDTLDRTIEGKETAQYLWQDKGIIPILKVDRGLEPEANSVQVM